MTRKRNKKRLLYFYAGWCPPCKFYDKTVITPLIERVGEDVIERIDVDERGADIRKYSIDKLPTVVILDEKDNVILHRYSDLSVDSLETILDS